MKPDFGYDVVVIGGGPSGSATATWLARAGLKTALLEEKRFPRFHVGESLLAMSTPILDELGLVPRLDSEFPRKYGALFVWGQDPRPRELYMPGVGFAYQVERSRFDHLLLENARAAGVEIYEQWRATDVSCEDNRVQGTIAKTVAGQSRKFRSHYVVDASGQSKLLSRRLGLQREKLGPEQRATFRHYASSKRLRGAQEYHIVTEAVGQGWLWHIPLTQGKVSVGFVTIAGDRVSEVGDALSEAIRSSKIIQDLLADAQPLTAGSQMVYRNEIGEKLSGPGYFIVGDAAAFVDPLLSTGVHAALYAAKFCSAAISSIIRGSVAEEIGQKFYDDAIRRHMHRVSSLISFLYAIGGKSGEVWTARSALLGADIETIVGGVGRVSLPFLYGGLDHLNIGSEMARVVESRFRKPSLSLSPRDEIRIASNVRIDRSAHPRGGVLVPSLSAYFLGDQYPVIEIEEASLGGRVLCWLNAPCCLGDLMNSVQAEVGRTGLSAFLEGIKLYADLGIIETI
ncbi:hypothetical protein CK218_12850 [Mesorhizobium sp. WSM3879]|uniref:NAD(P)/FAD-dependent oxidoreductase n=1 Tax=Mesorhizobium sp. WSM3879 TaxID=2029406 RepID=UPI000BB0A4A3|nr:NAD(P)/FAD-dependent oxidoreductase [Mesorhizobium sp. WSM3879]PBB81247.1 hypothetical protein CK218_12850 [Mesorhizobium sp. WSM3879]